MKSPQNFQNPLYEGSTSKFSDEGDDWPLPDRSCIGEDPTTPSKASDAQSSESYRTVHMHVTESARMHALHSREFCSNELVTSKYNIVTFIPVNLFQQFCRPANLYFLTNAAIQLIPGLSPTGWPTTVLPLSFVLILNAFKEAYDDFKRHRSDNEVNTRMCEVLQGEGIKHVKWKSIIVGDVIRVRCNSEIPADLLFLSSSDPQGLAYLETANLDGEMNLKIQNAFYQSSTLNPDDGDMSFHALSGLIIDCEQPNNKLYEFEGSVSFQGQGLMPFDVSQLLLRGATLRNTQWVIGAVVFTGADTKYMMNMVVAPRKVSHLERKMNILVAGVFIMQLLLCIGLAIGHFMWTYSNSNHYYLANDKAWPEPGLDLTGLVVQVLRFIILLSPLIPISLYVSLEIVKVFQCWFIQWDSHLVYKPAGGHAQTRTSNLNEELGQVQYVLADKTGTLTQNMMSFVQCSINGIVYGNLTKSSFAGEPSACTHTVCEDQYLIEELNKSNPLPDSQSQKCKDFFFHLAVCHTVLPTYSDEDETGEITYQASSPDEEALVQGAALCGFQLTRRTSSELTVESQGQFPEAHSILAVLEFTSERKRMSIICRGSDGRIKLYCKGADSVVLKRLAKDQGGIAEVSVKHMEEFAHAGFRTLCIAQREIDEVEFEIWVARFHAASVALDDREEKFAEAADSIEREMVLLGVTAVEDKLQDGVAETVTLLAQAGIKLWVLTGDKLETAVAIGLASNLLVDSMHLFLLCGSSVNSVPQLLHNMLEESRQRARIRSSSGVEASDMALIIEGDSLSVALEENNRTNFIELCQECRTVVCCRVSPLQKALVTQLVKENNLAVTLAIGDGANDVAMIKAAHIGIGISGREGMAAVLASDYAIGQFQFLARLLLVHGRWSYKRNKLLVMYAFYKNIVCVMGHCYLAFFSGLSAQSLYPTALIATYNLLWTSLPTMLLAVLDQDVHQRTVESNPQLYIETQGERIQSFFKEAGYWLMSGLWHSIVVFFFPIASIEVAGQNGMVNGAFNLGVAAYTLCIVIVNLKIVLCVNSFTLLLILVILIVSTILYFAFIPVVSLMGETVRSLNDLSGVGVKLYASASFWLLLLLGVIAAFLPDWTLSKLLRQRAPEDYQIFQEMEHGWMDGVQSRDHGFVGPLPRRPSMVLQERDSHDAALLELMAFPTNKVRPSSLESDELPSRRRMTWREVLSDIDAEVVSQPDVQPGWARRVSNGFEVVTSHTDVTTVPRSLEEGPLPTHRRAV